MYIRGEYYEQHFMSYLFGLLESAENGGSMTTRERGNEQRSEMAQSTKFSEVIEVWREKQGWTQERLADELGVSVATIGRWVRGKGLPQGTLRAKVMKETKMSAEDLGFLSTKEAPPEEVAASPVGTEVDASAEQRAMAPSSFLKKFVARGKHRRRIWHVGLAGLLLFLALSFPLYQHTRPARPPVVVGHVSFQSSNQTKDGSNEGINDTVSVALQGVPDMAPGKAYYAWLEPENREKPSLQLGRFAIHNGTATLMYQSPGYGNLLDVMWRFVVTEQDNASLLLGPSPRLQDQKYVATLPNIHPIPSASDPLSYEYSRYGLLDHLRHLLSSDPTLRQRGVQGGLVTLLNRQADQVTWWAKNARDSWESGIPDSPLIRDQALRILNVLNGTSTTLSPPLLVNRAVASFALLPQPGQATTESSIAHVDLHLRGVMAAPGASEQMRERAATLVNDLVGIVADLNTVRTDAEKLVSMSPAQLKSEQAFLLLNEAFHASNSAYAGPAGVFALNLSAEALTTMDVFVCTEALCRP